MKKQIACRVPAQGDGRRLEWVLQRVMELSPREISQAKFRPGGICVNQKPERVTVLVHAGDLVEVCLEEEARGSDQLLATPGELSILYEDEDLLAVYKPAGLVCHPAGGHYQDTLANVMQYYFREKGEQVVIRLVGRLDRETSGIVLAAKSQAAASRLGRQQELGILKKEYLAIVQGRPEPSAGWITEPIGPAEDCERGKAQKMQVRPDGKPARTYYETLETTEGVSLVCLRLATGRTHQIRVHMAFLGCPLVGDTLYHPLWNGKEEDDAAKEKGAALWNRLMTDLGDEEPHAALHAGRLEFLQPFTKEPICLTVPVPWQERYKIKTLL